GRDDADRELEAVLRPIDEGVVDLDAAEQDEERDADEQGRDGPERDRLEDALDHSLTSMTGAVARTGKNRCRTLAVSTAAVAPQSVETRVGAMTAVGSVEPAAARTPMIVVGMSCNPAVLSTRKVT